MADILNRLDILLLMVVTLSKPMMTHTCQLAMIYDIWYIFNLLFSYGL